MTLFAHQAFAFDSQTLATLAIGGDGDFDLA